MKRVLITGEHGYIGTSLAAFLNGRPDSYEARLISLRGDGWRRQSFAGYDAVFHAAGLAHQKETPENAPLYHAVNCELAVETARKAKEDGVRHFLYVSSMSVYGLDSGIITPETELKPVTAYGKSKLEAERQLLELSDGSFRVLILRLPMVYGPGCRGHYRTLEKLVRRAPLFPRINNRRSVLSIDTLCESVCALIDSGAEGLLFLQDDRYKSTRELAAEIAALYGKRLYFSRLAGLAAAAGIPFSRTLRKAFGTLIVQPLRREAPAPTQPPVSVVMPAYNAQRYIEAAIRSVQAQTFSDFELVVVDDCSTDGTEGLVRRLAAEDGRIRLLRNRENQGAARTRAAGIAAARGEWVAFLDSDDLWSPEKLEKQLALVKRRPDAVLCYTSSRYMDADGKPYGYILHAKEKTTEAELLRGNCIVCSSVLAKRSRMLERPVLREDVHEDYVTWIRLLREEPWAYGLDEPLTAYRLAAGSKSGSRLRSGLMLLRSYRCLDYGALRAAALTLRYLFYSLGKRRDIRKSGQVAASV